MTDSGQVPRGKGEKNPRQGSETDLKSCAHKLWERREARPFAFCIMSPRVTLRREVNREGSRSESESETGEQWRGVDPKPVRATLGQAEASVTGGGGPNESPLKRGSMT